MSFATKERIAWLKRMPEFIWDLSWEEWTELCRWLKEEPDEKVGV